MDVDRQHKHEKRTDGRHHTTRPQQRRPPQCSAIDVPECRSIHRRDADEINGRTDVDDRRHPQRFLQEATSRNDQNRNDRIDAPRDRAGEEKASQVHQLIIAGRLRRRAVAPRDKL